MKFLILTLLFSQSLFAAKLIKFKGDVTINNIEAVKGQMIKTGDTIEAVGGKSFALVHYEDGSRFMIKKGLLVINELDEKKNKNNLSLIRGIIFSYVKPNSSNKLSIKTKDASMGVRGTKFWLEADDKKTYLCVCDGAVEVTNGRGSATVKRNQDITLTSANDKLKVTPPNKLMWDMAAEGFEQLGVKVKDR